MDEKETSQKSLLKEIEELRERLLEALDALRAIHSGEVDALVVATPQGEQIYTIYGAEKPYRVLIEEMKEGAVILSDDNTILYCNSGFAKMIKCPLEKIVGINIESVVSPTYKSAFNKLLSLARTGKGAIAKEITLQTKDDTLVPTQISINSLQTCNITMTFLVVTDLTEHMEEEVKRYTMEVELAQLALSKSEQRWATTLASIGDAVIATDTSDKITFMNTVAEQLTEWTLNEAWGKPVQEIFRAINEFTRRNVEDSVARVIEKGMIDGLTNHTILVRKNGTEVAIDHSEAPIRGKDGKTTGVVLVFRDITERKKLEKEAHRLLGAVQQERDKISSLLNSINDEVWFADTEKRYTLANPSAIKEFKLDSSAQSINVENLVANLEVYRPDGSPRPVEEAPPLRALKGEIVKNQEEIIRTPASGELRYRQVSSAPVRDSEGNIIGSVSVVRDITEFKQLQNRLQEHAGDLEKLVEERTKQLKDSERLAAIGQTAGMVGHDIRNPLQAISGDLYLIREELRSMPKSEGKQAMEESVEAIEENTAYINKIVNDLQDYTRPLKPNIVEVNIKDLINSTLIVANIPENIKTETIQENLSLKVDPIYLRRALTNLTTNAVQAMPNGGKLTIKVLSNKDRTIISVKDTGVGIPEEAKPNLFKPLFTTKSKGQGLGLAVVKRLTEALGGTVTFESQEGKGAKFIIELPLEADKHL
ncbi:PAS domain S-box protein [Candidatus Bathyarchaeota archaeon]|nr:PAS domain S-box protein [Candidatus Bathyarchaeota archaeon]